MRQLFVTAVAMAGMAATAFCQTTDSFQVNVLQSPSGSSIPTGYVDITNSGALGASPTGPGTLPPTGDICVNVYAFAANQQEIQCCSCLVSPNALFHMASSDLTGSLGRRTTPTAGYVINLLATIPGPDSATPGTNAGPFTNTVCNAASTFAAQNLAPGMRATATKLQTFPNGTTSLTETAFQTAPLSPGQLTMMTNLCKTISSNFNGGGTCPSCSGQ